VAVIQQEWKREGWCDGLNFILITRGEGGGGGGGGGGICNGWCGRFAMGLRGGVLQKRRRWSELCLRLVQDGRKYHQISTAI